jgi:hypothetical protein
MFGLPHHRIPWLHISFVLLFVTVSTSALCAQWPPVKEKPALPEEDCQIGPAKNWTPQEKWVWNQVCCGKTADFNTAEGYDGRLDPKKKDIEWPTNRVISPAFLRTILLREPYQGALTRHGIHIVGAWFKEPLDLSGSTVTHELVLESCRFESTVNLGYLKTCNIISLNNSKFKETLSLVRLKTERDFSIRSAEFSRVDLRGAKIEGDLTMDRSTFAGTLDMDGLQVGQSLYVERGTKFAKVRIRGAKIGDDLTISRSTFENRLDMGDLQVGKNLSILGEAKFAEVSLRGAKIGGNLYMEESTFANEFDMTGLQVENDLSMTHGVMSAKASLTLFNAKIGRTLYMEESTFAERLDMTGLQVGNNLSIKGGAYSRTLNMDGLRVRNDLSMRGGAKFAQVGLRGAKIEGDLTMDRSTFAGTLDMDGLQVGNNLFMTNGATFKERLILTFAKIGRNLDLTGSTFNSVDLTGTHVRGTFIFGPPPTLWSREAKLTLRNTEVGVLPDPGSAWPDNLELDGFVYTSLENVPGTDINATKRNVSQFLGWLEKHKQYYPQPYEQLAAVFQKQGLKDAAEDLLYEGKNRELREATDQFHRLFLRFHKYFIGYKYRMYYAVFWILGFVLLGMIVLRFSKQGPANGMPYGIAYSIDMLLPIIKLRQKHYEIDLKGWARYYFYFQIMMGYVLASFIIAGLSGLTK